MLPALARGAALLGEAGKTLAPLAGVAAGASAPRPKSKAASGRPGAPPLPRATAAAGRRASLDGARRSLDALPAEVRIEGG